MPRLKLPRMPQSGGRTLIGGKGVLWLEGFIVGALMMLCAGAAATNVSFGQSAGGSPEGVTSADVLPGFLNPPSGYGEVAFYWWMADTLLHDRLLWQMDQLAGHGVTGLQINYAHSDSGGLSWGLTYPSKPRLFSEEWWKLFSWFLTEAKKRGMSVSLSDYTLGRAGQGWYVDEMLREDPSLCGRKLRFSRYDLADDSVLVCDVPEQLLSATAYSLNDGPARARKSLNLTGKISGQKLKWLSPHGRWAVILVAVEAVPTSLDPMNPSCGKKYIEKFFQRFEDRCPGEAGKGLNFFFSDELDFGIRGFLWNDTFSAEFKKRKNYDIVPELPALFMDVGPRTPKIRMDYNDVMVALSEERFFRPVYEWHQKRGMIFGCDHGGRGLDVTEFGDYFRTQRWMSGPGCDQPTLQRNIIKDKVASSIAHLYERPRTWLEGFHSSNWGTSSAQIADATFANFAMGQNLLTLHGLYYSTHGSWWEWAPPDNHFRQPYWAHMSLFLKCTERLSYLLSQGHHRCDVAILYPVAPMEAGLRGKESVATAFSAGNALYPAGIDFDFIDFQSVDRAQVRGRELVVSGEHFKVLVLPAMGAIKYSTIQKAVEFHRAGGIVVAIGALPEASDRVGRDDPKLHSMVKEIFGFTQAQNVDTTHVRENRNAVGGLGLFLPTSAMAPREIGKIIIPDFRVLSGSGNPSVLHRKAGGRDIYYVYGAARGSECFFRSKGRVELWNPWTGTTAPQPVLSSDSSGTRIHMPLTEREPQLIVFSPGDPLAESREGEELTKVDSLSLGGEWEFELKPTLDNRWGDYRLPAFAGCLGAEVTQIQYSAVNVSGYSGLDSAVSESQWTKTTTSYGPQFWRLGPLPKQMTAGSVDKVFDSLNVVDPKVPMKIDGADYYWEPYEFSWRWGTRDNPGHQGYHGLKGSVDKKFLEIGTPRWDWPGVPEPRMEMDPEGGVYYFWTSVLAKDDGDVRLMRGGVKPTRVWVNHAQLCDTVTTLPMKKGANPLLLRFDHPGRSFIVFKEANNGWSQSIPLSSPWYDDPSILPFDVQPQTANPSGWYRFTSPPGLRSLVMTAIGEPRIWVNGSEIVLRPGHVEPGRFPDTTLPVWRAEVPGTLRDNSIVTIQIRQQRGYYGGAAIPEPILLECGKGAIRLGDLSQNEVLRTYSGGMVYRKQIHLTSAQASSGKAILDLGSLVSSVEVRINGQLVGTRLTPPWQFDLTGRLRPGENLLEVLVYNTLGNHYLTTPSRYVGDITSGLLGPVSVRFSCPFTPR